MKGFNKQIQKIIIQQILSICLFSVGLLFSSQAFCVSEPQRGQESVSNILGDIEIEQTVANLQEKEEQGEFSILNKFGKEALIHGRDAAMNSLTDKERESLEKSIEGFAGVIDSKEAAGINKAVSNTFGATTSVNREGRSKSTIILSLVAIIVLAVLSIGALSRASFAQRDFGTGIFAILIGVGMFSPAVWGLLFVTIKRANKSSNDSKEGKRVPVGGVYGLIPFLVTMVAIGVVFKHVLPKMLYMPSPTKAPIYVFGMLVSSAVIFLSWGLTFDLITRTY